MALDIFYTGATQQGTMVYYAGGAYSIESLPSYFPEVFKTFKDIDGHNITGHIGEDHIVFNKVGGGTLPTVVGTRPPHR